MYNTKDTTCVALTLPTLIRERKGVQRRQNEWSEKRVGGMKMSEEEGKKLLL